MKKAVILSASPKNNGFTAKMIDMLKNTADKDIEFTLVNFFEKDIKPCKDCGYCNKKDGCSINDDSFNEITDLIKASDIVIAASPVYFLSYPSPLKAYCDRLQQYFSMRFIRKSEKYDFDRKKGILLMAYGADDNFAQKVMTSTTKMMFDCINTELCDVWCIGNTDKKSVNEIDNSENMYILKNIWKNLL